MENIFFVNFFLFNIFPNERTYAMKMFFLVIFCMHNILHEGKSVFLESGGDLKKTKTTFFFFFTFSRQNPIKILGSAGFIRLGRVTGITTFFLLGLIT